MKKYRKIVSLSLSLSLVTALFVGTYGNTYISRSIDFVKREATTKFAISWCVPSKVLGDDHENNMPIDRDNICNFDLEVYSSSGKLLKESTVYNSSSEVVVFNSENDKLDIYCCDYDATPILYSVNFDVAIAWY